MNSAIAQIISVFNPSILLFRVAELQELMSSKSFFGGLQEFWGALYGFAEQGCKWFSCVGFKDKQLLSVDWDAKPVSKSASAKRKKERKRNEQNQPCIHLSLRRFIEFHFWIANAWRNGSNPLGIVLSADTGVKSPSNYCYFPPSTNPCLTTGFLFLWFLT